MISMKVVSLFLLAMVGAEGAGKVLELSDRFLPLRKEGMWLIKFYAPWCGHCKKLEPVWKHVSQSLAESPVRVGRVDCTRFTAVSQEFGIRGFPTIMFLKGDDMYTYEGDRTREDIVAFTKRMMGPPVTVLTSISELNQAQRNQPFFLYVGSTDTKLYAEFNLNARHFQKDEFMFSASPEVVSNKVPVEQEPAVFVYKDDNFYQYKERKDKSVEKVTEPTSVVNSSLYSWMMGERFPMFVKVTRGKFGNILTTNKFVVMAVLEENKLLEITPEMEQFKSMVRRVIEENRDRYHDHFQFGWTGSPDLANSVAMETLSLPNLIVINSTTYQHHLPEDSPVHLTPEAITIFLDSILTGEAPSYGGSSWLVRVYRSFYEGRTALYEMWRGNPVLTAVLLGLPLGFLSLIFYSICCADIMDAEEEDEEEEFHEKNE